MIVTEQRHFGVFRYRKAYFPTVDQAFELTDHLAINDIVRFRLAPSDILDGRPGLIQRFPVSTVCVDLTQGTEAILKGMNAESRRRTRLGEKLRDRISIEKNTASVAEHFLELYNSFARAKGRVPRVSRKRVQAYAEVSDISVLYFDGRAMCGHVTVRDSISKRGILMFSATRRLEGKEEARLSGNLNRYLHWHELQDYQAQGMKIYDFGGIGHENPYGSSFNQFKLSFGGFIYSECSYTFSGAGLLARFGVGAYERIKSSRAAVLVSHL